VYYFLLLIAYSATWVNALCLLLWWNNADAFDADGVSLAEARARLVVRRCVWSLASFTTKGELTVARNRGRP
jgi:hypothetical protein